MKTQSNSRAASVLSTSRIEAFSDGVFAVAITLLVLNLQVPQLASSVVSSELLPKLFALWPKLLSYLLSFMIVGIYWVAHHNTFHAIQRSDRPLLWLNILLLLCIVFLPFPTALLGQYPEQRVSVIIYASTLVITGLVLQSLWWYATSGYRLVDREIDPLLVRRATRRNLMAPLIYLLAIGISFLSVQISLIIFIVVPVLYIFPGRIDRYWTLRSTHKDSPHQEADLSEDEGPSLSRLPLEERYPLMKQQQEPRKKGKAMEQTPGRTFYQRQIAALEARDMEALLAQYHADATLIGFDFTVKGHEAIRKHLEGYLERLGTLKLKSTDKFTETEDAIFFEATITSQPGEARVYDVFMLREGKATHHFTGIISLQSLP